MKPVGYHPKNLDEWNYRDYYLWVIAETLDEIKRGLNKKWNISMLEDKRRNGKKE